MNSALTTLLDINWEMQFSIRGLYTMESKLNFQGIAHNGIPSKIIFSPISKYLINLIFELIYIHVFNYLHQFFQSM